MVERFGVFDVGARHGVPVHESVTLEAVGAVREAPLPVEFEGRMSMQTRNPSPARTAARRENSRKSTGPRSCRGKRHSRRNALKHGLYSDVHYFYWEAAMELGEDPRDFTRLYVGLLEARHPADTLEQVLVEDLAVLIWKKARLERSESAVQVCNVRKHDLERRKQFMQVGRDGTTMSQAEVLEKGLRVTLDAPGKFEKVLEMLGMLEDLRSATSSATTCTACCWPCTGSSRPCGAQAC